MDDNKKDVRDRNQIAVNQQYEIEHLARDLGTNIPEVEKAIKAVDKVRKKIKLYLKKRKG